MSKQSLATAITLALSVLAFLFLLSSAIYRYAYDKGLQDGRIQSFKDLLNAHECIIKIPEKEVTK